MSRKIWYPVITAAIVVAFIFTSVSIYYSREAEKEQTLVFELSQLRGAILLYVKIHHQNPESLEVALNEKYSFETPQWSIHKNEQGMPVDPFGNVFQYDNKTGFVRSSSEKYQGW